MKDIIVIGRGPAGISAAIYATRAGMDVLVVAKDNGALEKADKIENFYGFEQPTSGKELAERGLAQAKRLGVSFLDDEVTAISFDGSYVIKTLGGEQSAKAVILATGTSRAKPKINGLDSFEGRGVSYCATCDGFFYKGKNVAVLGSGEYALNEASELLPIASSVTVLTNGSPLTASFPESLKVIETKISALEGENLLSGIRFDDDSELSVNGLFIAMGVAGSADFARKIGAMVEGNRIIVDENMATNVPGLYAAGDCTGAMFQVSKAVYEGAKAGTEATHFVRNQK